MLRGVRQAVVSGGEVVDHVRHDADRSVEPYWRFHTKDAFGILLSAGGHAKVHIGYIFRDRHEVRLESLFPSSDTVANLLGATQSDDRVMIRTLVDMLFWNTVVVIVALVIFL
jgi:hypothetical protein